MIEKISLVKKLNIRLAAVFSVTVALVLSVVYILIVTEPQIKELYFLSGEGTAEDPYLINTVEELSIFRDLVNEGVSFAGEYVKQTADLDLSQIENWTPIGKCGYGRYFYGTYDGDGHVIRNFNCIDVYAGFFGYLFGEVRNFGIESGHVEGAYIGGITSHGGPAAVIFNCYNKASVHASGRAGGIADNVAKIMYCWNFGDISCDTGIIGGISSYSCNEIVNCYSKDIHIVPEIFKGDIYDSATITVDEINNGFMEQVYGAMYQYLNDSEVFDAEWSPSVHYMKVKEQTISFDDMNEMPEVVSKSIIRSSLIVYGAIILLVVSAIIFLFFCGSRILNKQNNMTVIDDPVKEEKLKEMVVKEISVHRKFTGSVLFIAFLLIGGLIVDKTLLLKRDDGVLTIQDYYQQPSGTVDVLLLGSSKCVANFDCEVFWKEYGISSFGLWGSSQPFWNTYYYLNEAIRINRPKVVVLETNAGTYAFEYSDNAGQYVNTYGLKMSLDKVEAVQASAPQECWADLLLGFPIYHTRYTELVKLDFDRYPWNLAESVGKGGHIRYGCGTLEGFGEPTDITTIQKMAFKEELYLRRIIELCQRENLPLVLVEGPVADRPDKQPYFNYIQTIADEYGIPFINYNILDRETGFDVSDMWIDNVHSNTKGGRKISSHFGQYLKDN